MALKQCKECGNSVSSKAEKCPQCGAPRKKSSGCAVLVVVGALVLFISYQLADNDSSTSRTSGSNSPAANDSHSSDTRTTASKTAPGPFNGKIAAMTEPERRQFFTDYLRQSQKDCTSVARTFFQGFDSEQQAYWNVECSSGEAYAISIANDSTGSTRVLEKEILDLLGIEMFKKFDE